MYYKEQRSWEQIAAFLPERLRFTEDFHPTEEVWDWKGCRVHLDAFRNADAPAKVILFHGVGTNGRQMSTILGGPLAKDGFEVVAIDMPLYGETQCAPKMTVTYDDWVALGNDYVSYEQQRDDRPVFLYGLSAGGMETYHVASLNKKVKGIIGMTFLDQLLPQVRLETANGSFWGKLGVPLVDLSIALGLGKFRMPMSVVSKMYALCNNDDCLKVMLKDRTSSGNRVPLRFLSTYMKPTHPVQPEDFDVCPILLTQPEKDRWTPLHLSQPFLSRIHKVPVQIKFLENGGHYPVEEPALTQLHDHILEFINDCLNK